MSATGTESTAAVGVIQSLRKLATPSRSRGGFYAKAMARKRLGISRRALERMLFLGRLVRVRVRGRFLIYLP